MIFNVAISEKDRDCLHAVAAKLQVSDESYNPQFAGIFLAYGIHNAPAALRECSQEALDRVAACEHAQTVPVNLPHLRSLVDGGKLTEHDAAKLVSRDRVTMRELLQTVG